MISTEAVEQFMVLSKSAQGKSCEPFINQLIANPQIFLFRQFLNLPSITDLKNGSLANYYELLRLFTYGNYKEYKTNSNKYPALAPNQLKKLKQLTLMDMAASTKVINFESLTRELEISDQRELEDLIIDSIYAGIINGKINQEKKTLKIFSVLARDTKDEELVTLVEQLKNLKTDAKKIESTLNQDIEEMNRAKLIYLENRRKLDSDRQKAIQNKAAIDAAKQH